MVRLVFAVTLAVGAMVSCRDGDIQEPGQVEGVAVSKSLSTRSESVPRSSRGAENELEFTAFTEAAKDGQLETYLKNLLLDDEEQALAVLARLQQLPDGVPYEDIIQILRNFYLQRNPADGLDALLKLAPNPDLSISLSSDFAKAQWQDDPEAARDWIFENSQFVGSFDAAVTVGELDGGTEFAQSHFTSVMNSPVDSSLKANYLKGLVSRWVEQDFNGVFSFLQDMEAAPVLDSTFYHLVTTAVRVSPRDVMSWAEAITEEGLRNNAIMSSAVQWQITDLEGYQEWRNGAELSEELQNNLP